MDKIISYLKDLSNEKGFYFFLNEDTKEIWISGVNNNVRFDLLVRPIKKRYIKVIYDTPFKRVPILFLDEESTLKKLKKIFNSDTTQEKSKVKFEGENIFGFNGYTIERA